MGTTYQIGGTIRDYDRAAGTVNLGDSKDQVLAVLMPTQERLKPSHKKSPDRFMRGDTAVEIHYMRSGWQQDNLTTDDEFTPYIFENGRLSAVGWQTLGGPKTRGQATSDVYVDVETKTRIF